jgi:hypothetical protein
MRIVRIGFRLCMLTCLVCFGYALLIAQKSDSVHPAQIATDDFSRTRDLLGNSSIDLSSANSVFVFKKPTYKLKRVKPPIKYAASKNRPPSAKQRYELPVDKESVEVWKRLGVTIWRLPADGDGEPKRVSAETRFSEGDQIRLSFESPAAGYLYVIDRELYADEKVGDPLLVFPTMLTRNGNNRVEAGQVVDVPGQTDRVPFFKLESKNKDWRGELLTVIVSPEPLKDIETPDKIAAISAAWLEAMENTYLKSVAEYEQQGSEGRPYTQAEKVAGSSLTRELTQKDPFPQTMFRVKMRPKEPMMVNLGLTVK